MPRMRDALQGWSLLPVGGVLLFLLGHQLALQSSLAKLQLLSHPQGAGHGKLERMVGEIQMQMNAIDVRLARIEQWQSKLEIPPPEQKMHNRTIRDAVDELKDEIAMIMRHMGLLWHRKDSPFPPERNE